MRTVMLILCFVLSWMCEIQHFILSDKQDERLNDWFIEIIGYHCPFTTWSYKINEKYKFNIWKEEKD